MKSDGSQLDEQIFDEQVFEECPKTSFKLKSAYIDERVKLETIEVELNRSKIVVVDENGKLTKFTLISEH
ncbi:hypothetical protein [Vibrio vulnificus YJ016]|uniref:Uncharacterized protein n=1 Tax=Vibrio vulnificus (strain YJ016) TaxID=196600 RepID=Q7MD10_VIBVY|nr:hypothetical protein [Vibrio vulnificus]ALM73583.1 hypothetical protein FORC9_4066 [Vibrio vulnificus]AMG10488.1 hypothetical protein AL549_03885 [Vibrio vulnificus]ANH65943.1 hypothetical protein FORC16_4060 [Vibrio vulnificus]EGQ8173117.1 hypothetical protein [Vibrio vulnificus]EGR0236025.1 hypothetical protein [Vibrio vulnificus]